MSGFEDARNALSQVRRDLAEALDVNEMSQTTRSSIEQLLDRIPGLINNLLEAADEASDAP